MILKIFLKSRKLIKKNILIKRVTMDVSITQILTKEKKITHLNP